MPPLYGYDMTEANKNSSPAGRALVLTAVIELTGVNPYVRVDPDRAQLLKPDWRRPMERRHVRARRQHGALHGAGLGRWQVTNRL